MTKFLIWHMMLNICSVCSIILLLLLYFVVYFVEIWRGCVNFCFCFEFTQPSFS